MAIAPPRPPLPLILLRLGRVSNLPTVWTNVLAGTVLAGSQWQSWHLAAALLAMSFFYIAGMYLNDYFDRAVDARERPGRPIPAGYIAAEAVALTGLALLAGGILLLATAGILSALIAVVLAATIVGYDLHHKTNPLAPVVMGSCRALVYCGAAAAAAGSVPPLVAAAALALLAYVAGLTYAARLESLNRVDSLWPLLALAAPMVLALPAFQHGPLAIAIYLALVGATAYSVYLLAKRPFAAAVPTAVAWLIAAVSLVDAALLASVGASVAALVALAGFAATLVLQRYIAGT
jgi:4-hydroxybenzoate polyprenyltransferase